jgi:hypothetical protein
MSNIPRPKRESDAPAVNWLELDRSPHAIQFYSSEEFLLDSLSRFISTALEAGDSCFVFATEAHFDGLADRLKARGVRTDAAVRKGRYVTANASEVLARLMVNGKLDRTRFEEFIREVLLPLKNAAVSKSRGVAVCGELVAMLWAQGKAEDAIEIERFWNELATEGCYYLRCFYPITSFSDPGQNKLFLKLCAEHAGLIPRESEVAQLDEEERLASIVMQFEAHGK